jgi:DNA-binding IclR family transcriptional regulator
VVGKVVRIVETLRDAPQGFSLHALTGRTGFVKSSVHRILLSLGRHGFVQQACPTRSRLPATSTTPARR